MSATHRATPGSAAAVVDSVVRSVTEGRYRYACLQILWGTHQVLLDDLADLINEASTIADPPAGLVAADVIARGKPPYLPEWLDAPIDEEIGRACSGRPAAQATPIQLVARVAATVCIDVWVDVMDATARALETDTSASHRSRMIHLDAPDRIDLGDDVEIIEIDENDRADSDDATTADGAPIDDEATTDTGSIRRP